MIILCWGHPCLTVTWVYLVSCLTCYFYFPHYHLTRLLLLPFTSSPHWAGRGSIRPILKDFAIWPSCVFLWWHSLDYVNPKEKAAGVNKNEKDLNNFLNGLFRNNCTLKKTCLGLCHVAYIQEKGWALCISETVLLCSPGWSAAYHVALIQDCPPASAAQVLCL